MWDAEQGRTGLDAGAARATPSAIPGSGAGMGAGRGAQRGGAQRGGALRGGALARTLRRNRRTVAAAAAGLSILALGTALQPAPPATRAVVVAADALPAGHRLTAADLAVAQVPDGVLPDGVAGRPEALVGRVLAAAVARGEAVAGSRLVDASAFAGLPPGTAPMPVRFPDAGAARLLAAGQRVDVLAAGSLSGDGMGGPTVGQLLAEDVLVLAVVEGGDSSSDSLAGGGSQGPLVVLAIARASAVTVAAAQAQAHLSFAISPTGP